MFINVTLLGGEQAWTPSLYLKSFDMDSVQVGKAVFGKEIHTTLGIEPRTYSYPGRYGNPYSVCQRNSSYLQRHLHFLCFISATSAWLVVSLFALIFELVFPLLWLLQAG